MPVSTRTRQFYMPAGASKWTNDAGKTWHSGSTANILTGSQTTDSIGHSKNPKTGSYESGGPFYTVRSELSFPTVPYDRTNPFNKSERVIASVGTPMPDVGSATKYLAGAEEVRKRNLSDLNASGATAIAQCAPTNPYSHIATTLAESHREGLPSLPGIQSWKKRTEIAKAAGSEYLNAVFGWLPLVSEVKDVGHAARHSRDILTTYRHDEGRNTRRTFSFPSTNSSSTTVIGPGYTAGPFYKGGGWNFGYATEPLENQGTLTRTTVKSSRTWFSGCFTYTMQPFGDSLGGIQSAGSEADKLFGTDLTPDVLWELTPWSWAVDWFSNTGDVIHNFTSLESLGLVMRYGYIMSETTEVTTYSLSRTGLYGLGSVPDSKVETISKVRGEANPFGFGISWQGLSPAQLAITAALGITRLL